jgi:hypothetical protein
MGWLKDHVYIATWLGVVLAIVTAFARGWKSEGAPVDWFRFVLWFTFFLCLAVTFTPQFDETARAYAKNLAYILLGPILIYKKGF